MSDKVPDQNEITIITGFAVFLLGSLIGLVSKLELSKYDDGF